MLKRIILSLLVAILIAVPVLAAGPEIEFDVGNLYPNAKEYTPLAAYTLSNNGSYGGTGEGIQAGWTYDGRGDYLRTNVTDGYGTITDISTENGSCLYRDLNKTSEGKIYMETAVSFKNGFDGLEIFFSDEAGNKAYSLKTDEGALWLLDGETYTKFYEPTSQKKFNVKAYIDFTAETPVVKTVIDDSAAMSVNFLSDNFMRFGFKTSDEDVLVVVPSGVKITANYLVDNEFKYCTSSSVKSLPYGWTTSSLNNAYVLGQEGYIKNDAYMAKGFASSVDKGVLATEVYLFARPEATGKVALTSLGGEKVVFSFDGTDFSLNDTVVYENYLTNFWYRLRFEVDLDAADGPKGKVYVNGRVVAEDVELGEIEYLNAVKLTASGEGILFDNILIHSIVKANDYVPTPVVPADSKNNIVGINVCSLWSYESNHGWLTVTPYDDFKPILGYYDEGSPEVADWEIKMMVEHGIDFQAFCWYGSNWTNGSGEDQLKAVKYPAHSLQLHEGYMYAEYADLMDYCLIWEASNGGIPETAEEFQNVYVPYWIENYFKDPRYLVIDNKPVLLIFGYGRFINAIGGNAAAGECMDYLRNVLKEDYGFDGLIVILSNATDAPWVATAGADAVCRYNWGTNGKDVDYTIDQIRASAELSAKEDYTWTVPTLSTGFNSLPWAGKRYGNMTPEDFETGLEYMRDDYFTEFPIEESWQQNLYMLSTWNEYGEGTYIMPSEALHGYGYLEAIRNVMTDADNTAHVDNIPTESQLERIGKNYPQHIRVLRRNDTYEPDVEKTLASIADTVFSGHELFKVGGCENVSYENGISGKATDSTAYVETADVLGIEIADSAALSVEMTVDVETTVSVWYTTDDSQYYTSDKVLTFDAVPGTTTHTVDFTMSDITLRSLRIMPTTKDAVNFTINKVSVLNPLRLYIDGLCLESKVYPENIDGTVYYPFDPRLAQGFLMNCHFTWDYATQVLTIFADNGKWIEYTVGSDVALTDDGEVELPYEVYLSDNLPMLYMETLCDELGLAYENEATGLHIITDKYAQNNAFHTRPENEWNFTSGSNLGWTADNVILSIADDNSLNIKAYENDPRVYSATLALDAAKYKGIEVEIKYNSTSAENLSFFFVTDESTGWDEAKHLMQRLPSASSGDEFVTVYFDLKDVNTYAPISWKLPEEVELTWADTITKLRLDAGDKKDFECWIKSIKLIPDETYVEESPAIIKTEFTSVTFDAEDGEMPFYTDDNAEVSIVEVDGRNVYQVSPKAGYEKGIYLSLLYNMNYEPGATYTVSFDYRPMKNGKSIAADFVFVDPTKTGANANNHYFSNTSMSSSEWHTHTATITIGNDCFDRTGDRFRIYTDPTKNYYITGNDTVGFYVDNLVITKTTSTVVDEESVAAVKSGSSVTVSGNTQMILPGEKSVVVAVYNGTRLLGMKVVHLNESNEFACDFANAADATKAKVFTLSGLRSFAPQASSVEVSVQ